LKNKGRQLGILFFLLIGVLPFVAAFMYALLYSVGVVGVLNTGFTGAYWRAVFESGEFVKSFGYSALIAAISVTVSVSLAMGLVLTYRREFEKKVLSFMLYLPLAIPGVVAAFFTFQLLSKSGFFARIMYALGGIEEAREFPDLVNDQWAIGMLLTFISIVTPFFMLLFMNVYKHERIGALIQLAGALGATKRQALWKVSVPILLRKTWTIIALYFIFILGAYEVPLILGQESPQMLSVLIIRELKQFDLTKLPEGYVVAVVYTLVVATATVVLFYGKRKSAYAR
jgi:putative spermidine/putrescine transport system permease protein